MALQVWLPLNGNLNNQGLNNVTITNNGAVVNDNGKIGKCYSFDGVNDYIDTGWGNNHISKNLSICLWVKPLSSLNNKIVFGVLNGTNQRLYLGIKDDTYNIAFRGHSWGRTSNAPATINVWSYLVITVDNNNRVLLYQDGVLTNETYTSSADFNFASNVFLGGRTDGYYANCLINDFRIYDHCLSPKEVKEISKGLILHYKLDDEYIEGTTNLFSNITLTWGGLTCSTLSSKTSDIYTVTIGDLLSGYTYATSRMNIPLSILEDNAQYSMSFKYKVISGNGTIRLNSCDWCDKSFVSKSETVIGEYHYIKLTCPIRETYNNTYRFVDFFWTDSNTVFEISDIQLEKKDHVTPYVNGTRTPTTVYDSSGYGNNGTINGDFVISDNSGRYNKSTIFNGSNTSIKFGNLSTFIHDGIFTFSCWFNVSTFGTKNWGTIIGGPSGFEFQSKRSSSNNPLLVAYSWGQSSSGGKEYELDKWNMVTMVRTKSNCLFYLNGELYYTGSAGSIPSGDYFIGSWKIATSQNYKGSMSDVRIYTTALSEKSIKELYNIAGYVDNSGDVFQYKLEERCENLFKLEYWNETINLTRSGNQYVEYTDRNGSKAIPLNASWFYYGNNDERNHHLRGKFKENTQYKFDFWIDYDDIMYQGSNTSGGLIVFYTDGTRNSTLQGTGNSETPMGWQHKYFISAENKTIEGIYVAYNVNTPAFYRWDSTIVEIDNKSTKINKFGINSTGQFRECSDIAKINKGNHFDTNKIIEI